jgi:heme exporter protein A
VDDGQQGLVVEGVARRFGPRWALAHVTFSVPGGGACQLTGANGSGKSTLLRCLASALRPHEGRIHLDGRDVWADRTALRPRIAFLSHASRLYEDLSARDNLRVWAGLGGIAADLDALIVRVGLQPGRRDPVRTFSAGMRRRLSLAVALLKRPRLLLLDEPFTALDPSGRGLVIDVVHELQAEGTIVVLATHLPMVAKAITERGLHLDAGRVVAREGV